MTGDETLREAGDPAAPTVTETKPAPAVITVDYEKYAHFLEDADLAEEQKREFLQAVWEVIVGFVSLGFGVHPVQQANNACGYLEEISLQAAPLMLDGLHCRQEILTNTFDSATDAETDRMGEGVEQ